MASLTHLRSFLSVIATAQDATTSHLSASTRHSFATCDLMVGYEDGWMPLLKCKVASSLAQPLCVAQMALPAVLHHSALPNGGCGRCQRPCRLGYQDPMHQKTSSHFQYHFRTLQLSAQRFEIIHHKNIQKHPTLSSLATKQRVHSRNSMKPYAFTLPVHISNGCSVQVNS